MFKDVFVINLVKDEDRMINIQTNFNKYGIPFKRIDAIYGKNLSQEEIKQNTTFLCRTLLCNKSIIGSAMSHFKTWQHISTQPSGFYMVCEDDVNFTDRSITSIEKILLLLQGKEEEPLLVSLNSCESYHYHASNTLIIKGNMICGISCYILTPETAKRLVYFINKQNINQYIDMQMNFCRCGIQYYVTTIPIVQDSMHGGYKSSNNMGGSNSIPLLQFLIELFLPHNWSSVLNFRLNIIIFCFFMSYCLSLGTLIFLLIVCLNFLFWKNTILSSYLLLEFILMLLFYAVKLK
jgi:GR25 family glycosyltransferase involved in LPS biosynthesis